MPCFVGPGAVTPGAVLTPGVCGVGVRVICIGVCIGDGAVFMIPVLSWSEWDCGTFQSMQIMMAESMVSMRMGALLLLFENCFILHPSS